MKRLGLIKNNVARLMTLPLLAGLLSCQAPQQSSVQAENLTARELVEQNVFLDVDQDVQSRSAMDLIRTPAFRAACYRFYKNVSYDENNIGTCKASKGTDLNISDYLFDDLSRELETLNEKFREDKEKGIASERGVKDEQYFERLLNDEFFEQMKNSSK